MMRTLNIIFVGLVLPIIISCGRKRNAIYDFHEVGLSLKVEERDSFDVFILNGTDSLFTEPNHGHYYGFDLYICGNNIYINNKGDVDDEYSMVKRIVQCQYKIKCLPFSDYETDFSLVGDSAVRIFGTVEERGVSAYCLLLFDNRSKYPKEVYPK